MAEIAQLSLAQKAGDRPHHSPLVDFDVGDFVDTLDPEYDSKAVGSESVDLLLHLLGHRPRFTAIEKNGEHGCLVDVDLETREQVLGRPERLQAPEGRPR